MENIEEAEIIQESSDSLFYWLYKMAFFGLTIAVIIGTLLYLGQNKMIYMPNPPMINSQSPDTNPNGYRSPGERNMKYEDIYLRASDGINLHAWLIKTDTEDAPTIVFFHANAGNMGLRMDNLIQFNRSLDCNVIILSYRGYGNSEGQPDEQGIQRDSQALMDWIFKKQDYGLNTNKIFIFGRSLGGAVAIYAAYSNQDLPIRGLILENTFTSMSDMVDSVLPWVSFMKHLILRNYWPSAQRIEQIKFPILFISGQQDELVPPAQMKRLYDSAKNSRNKVMFEVEGGDHNLTWMRAGESYPIKVREFIETCLTY